MIKQMIESLVETKLFQLIEKNKVFLKFAIVGCINTSFDFFIFFILRNAFSLDYLLCQIGGYSSGIICSFFLNKIWTFESKSSHFSNTIELVKFVMVNMASLALSMLGLKILKGYLDINVYIVKIMITGLAQVVNYTGYKFWVFKKV